MNNDIGDMLRQGIGRLEVPPGTGDCLTARARRKHRIRQKATRAGATAGTAAALGAAVTVMVTLGASGPAPGTGHTAIRTVADVARHMRTALARANLIEQVTVSGGGALHFIEPTVSSLRGLIFHLPVCAQSAHPSRHGLELCHKGQLGPARLMLQSDDALPQSTRAVGWSYQGRLREEGLNSRGQLVFDASSVAGPSGQMRFPSVRYQSVDYVHKTWGRGLIPEHQQIALLGDGAGTWFGMDDWSSASWPTRIRQMLTSPAYRIVGRQRIGGIDAIKIKGVWPCHGYCPSTQMQEILWVDLSSYLPLRDDYIWFGHHGPVASQVASYRWLAPTPARFAALRATVPHGFHRAAQAGTIIPGEIVIIWANH